MYIPRKVPVAVRRLIPLLGFVALFASRSAVAQDGQELQSIADEGRGVQLERIVELQPVTESQPLIQDFKAEIFSDGSVRLSGSGKGRAGGRTTAIEFEADLSNETYTTRRLDAAEIEDSSVEALVLQDDNNLVSKAIVPGSRWGRVRLQTVDPVSVVLADSSSKLEWNTLKNGKVSWIRRTDTCAAANPSSLGTHWFKKGCTPGQVWYTSSSTRVCHDHRAAYYNYDFGLNSLRTDAGHYIMICGRNDARFDYSWSTTHSGEWAILLRGRVILN